MSFDIKSAIATVAPTLATMLGGPLAGTAITALESALNLPTGIGQAGVTQALQGGLTPDNIAAVRAADQKHAEVLAQQNIDLQKMNLDFQMAQTAAVINDRIDARKENSGRDAVWWIAVCILFTFALVMGGVLWGCWTLLQGGITIHDVSVVAAISGLVGSVVGYVAANAQTVVNFIYGGSLGSDKKTDAMAGAVQQALSSAAGR